jgi:hypothetical protein
MIDIDKMTSNEWINYRYDLIDDFYSKGYVLRPKIGCSQCDSDNDYVCFDCECNQLEAIK